MKLLKLACFFACLASPFFCGETVAEPRQNGNISFLTPDEELMGEHGILNRILLIYQELSRRINTRVPFPLEVVADAVHITRDFLENHHERMEDEYVFPYFKKANLLVDLVKNLEEQHQSGRKLTDYMLAHCSKDEIQQEIQAMVLAGYMDIFCRMFRPHEARESSDLFPVFPTLMSRDEYLKLGELFMKKEEEMFGTGEYTRIVSKITDIELKLGLHTLPQFTSTI